MASVGLGQKEQVWRGSSCAWSICRGPGAPAQGGVRGACTGRRVTCSVRRRAAGACRNTGGRPLFSLRSFRKAFHGRELCRAASRSVRRLGQEITDKPGQDLCCCHSCFIERVQPSLPPSVLVNTAPRPHTPHCPYAGGMVASSSRGCHSEYPDRPWRDAKCRGTWCTTLSPRH